MKRFITFALAVIMVASFTSIFAFAAQEPANLSDNYEEASQTVGIEPLIDKSVTVYLYDTVYSVIASDTPLLNRKVTVTNNDNNLGTIEVYIEQGGSQLSKQLISKGTSKSWNVSALKSYTIYGLAYSKNSEDYYTIKVKDSAQ